MLLEQLSPKSLEFFQYCCAHPRLQERFKDEVLALEFNYQEMISWILVTYKLDTNSMGAIALLEESAYWAVYPFKRVAVFVIGKPQKQPLLAGTGDNSPIKSQYVILWNLIITLLPPGREANNALIRLREAMQALKTCTLQAKAG